MRTREQLLADHARAVEEEGKATKDWQEGADFYDGPLLGVADSAGTVILGSGYEHEDPTCRPNVLVAVASRNAWPAVLSMVGEWLKEHRPYTDAKQTPCDGESCWRAGIHFTDCPILQQIDKLLPYPENKKGEPDGD